MARFRRPRSTQRRRDQKGSASREPPPSGIGELETSPARSVDQQTEADKPAGTPTLVLSRQAPRLSQRAPSFQDSYEDADLGDIDDILDIDLDAGSKKPKSGIAWSEAGDSTRRSSPLRDGETPADDIWQFDDDDELSLGPLSVPDADPNGLPDTISLPQVLHGEGGKEKTAIDFSETATTVRRSSPFRLSEASGRPPWDFNDTSSVAAFSTVQTTSDLPATQPLPQSSTLDPRAGSGNGGETELPGKFEAAKPSALQVSDVDPLQLTIPSSLGNETDALSEDHDFHQDSDSDFVPRISRKSRKGVHKKTSPHSNAAESQPLTGRQDKPVELAAPAFDGVLSANQAKESVSITATARSSDKPAKTRKQRAKAPLKFDDTTQVLEVSPKLSTAPRKPSPSRMPIVSALRASVPAKSNAFKKRKRASPKKKTSPRTKRTTLVATSNNVKQPEHEASAQRPSNPVHEKSEIASPSTNRANGNLNSSSPVSSVATSPPIVTISSDTTSSLDDADSGYALRDSSPQNMSEQAIPNNEIIRSANPDGAVSPHKDLAVLPGGRLREKDSPDAPVDRAHEGTKRRHSEIEDIARTFGIQPHSPATKQSKAGKGEGQLLTLGFEEKTTSRLLPSKSRATYSGDHTCAAGDALLSTAVESHSNHEKQAVNANHVTRQGPIPSPSPKWRRAIIRQNQQLDSEVSSAGAGSTSLKSTVDVVEAPVQKLPDGRQRRQISVSDWGSPIAQHITPQDPSSLHVGTFSSGRVQSLVPPQQRGSMRQAGIDIGPQTTPKQITGKLGNVPTIGRSKQQHASRATGDTHVKATGAESGLRSEILARFPGASRLQNRATVQETGTEGVSAEHADNLKELAESFSRLAQGVLSCLADKESTMRQISVTYGRQVAKSTERIVQHFLKEKKELFDGGSRDCRLFLKHMQRLEKELRKGKGRRQHKLKIAEQSLKQRRTAYQRVLQVLGEQADCTEDAE